MVENTTNSDKFVVTKQKMNVTLAYGSRANSAGQSTYLNSVCVPTECLATLGDRLIRSRVLQYGELCTFCLVRSQLGYASQVWAPQSIELIARLERIQRRASKYILDLPFISNTTYSDRLNQLQPLPFAYWLEYLYLIFSFECVNGIFDLKNEIVPNAAQTNKATRSTTDVSCLLYETKLCNTSTYQKSFISKTIRTCNSLPKQLRSNINSLSSFKSLLFKYYITALISNYHVEDWEDCMLKMHSGT